MSEKVKNEVYYKRKQCLDDLFSNSRKTNCYYSRVLQKNKKIIDSVVSKIIHLMTSADQRFSPEYYTRCESTNEYQVFVELLLGSYNPSVYLFKTSQWSMKVALEAESKKMWKKFLVPDEEMSFLNASMLRCYFHRLLSKACVETTSNKEDMETMCKELGVQSVQVEDVAKLLIQVSNFNGKRVKTLQLNMIPTLRIPPMCSPYVQQCFGSVTPALVAMPYYADGMDPELLWPLSYHAQEQVAMDSFPMSLLQEAFQGTINICNNDPVLRLLSRETILHIFLEISMQTKRWIEVRYDDLSQLREEDCNYMSEFFFTDLLQKLESEFIPNHFNPEMNLLELSELNPTQIKDLVNRVRMILRGNCECCLLSVVEKISRTKKKDAPGCHTMSRQLPSYISSSAPRECNT